MPNNYAFRRLTRITPGFKHAEIHPGYGLAGMTEHSRLELLWNPSIAIWCGVCGETFCKGAPMLVVAVIRNLVKLHTLANSANMGAL